MTEVMETISIIRHAEYFSPRMFAQVAPRIDVIGAGATGSRILEELARLTAGLVEIHVWDFDMIEGHNIANQKYGKNQIGMLKIEAVAQRIFQDTGVKLVIHNEKVDGSQMLGQIVFVLVDDLNTTPYSRKAIWEKGLKFKLNTKLVIETRMGKNHGRVYAVNPSKREHIQEYENTLEGKVAETSACGSPISIGATAEIVSGFALSLMMKWYFVQNGQEGVIMENEVIFSTSPFRIMARTF